MHVEWKIVVVFHRVNSFIFQNEYHDVLNIANQCLCVLCLRKDMEILQHKLSSRPRKIIRLGFPAAVAESVRAFASHAEGWVLESQLQHT